MRHKCEHCGVKSRFSQNRAGTEVLCPNCGKLMHLHDSIRNQKRRIEAESHERQQRQHEAQKQPLPSKNELTPLDVISSKVEEASAKKTEKLLKKTSSKFGRKINKPASKTVQKLSHKETVAKIAAENRAYFEKQETNKPLGKRVNAKIPQDAKQKSVPMINVQKLDVATLESQVRASIEEFYSNKPAYSSFQIGNLTLIHESGNKYVGMFEVLNNNEREKLEVSVVYDGRSFMWQVTEKRNLQSNPIQETPPIREMPYAKIPAQIFDNAIRCQMCGSSNIAKIPFPLNTFKSFKCWSCGYKW